MLAADYADARACPCGTPARKRGRWSHDEGEWFFTPEPLIVGERHVLPYKNANRWEHVTLQKPKYNRDGEQVGLESLERYHYIVTHECSDPECKRGELLQLRDTEHYTGPHIAEFMDAPTSLRAVDRMTL